MYMYVCMCIYSSMCNASITALLDKWYLQPVTYCAYNKIINPANVLCWIIRSILCSGKLITGWDEKLIIMDMMLPNINLQHSPISWPIISIRSNQHATASTGNISIEPYDSPAIPATRAINHRMCWALYYKSEIIIAVDDSSQMGDL